MSIGRLQTAVLAGPRFHTAGAVAPGRRLRATEHRVLSLGVSRDAVGFFYCPHPGATLPLEAGRAYDPDDESTFPWARFSSNSTAPYRPGKTARVDTSPQKALDDPANLKKPSKLKLKL